MIFPALSLLAVVGLSAFLAPFLSRRAGLAKESPAFRILVVLAVAMAAELVVLQALNAPLERWNGIRLAPSYAVRLGVRIFYPGTEGPAIGGLNGLVQVLSFLPATLFGRPSVAIIVGSFQSLLFYFVPAFLLFGLVARGGVLWLLGAAFVLVSLSTDALTFSASLVHADAPGLGLSALCVWFLHRSLGSERRRRMELFAVLAATGAAMTKMVFLPVLALPALHGALVSGGRGFLRGAGLTTAAYATGMFVSALFVGFEGMFFQTLAMPMEVPWIKSPRYEGGLVYSKADKLKTLFAVGWEYLYRYWVWFFGTVFAVVATLQTVERSRWRETAARSAWMTMACAAVLLIPTSLAGWAKAGGAPNTHSPGLYFLVLASLSYLAFVVGTAPVPRRAPAFLGVFGLMAVLLGTRQLMLVAMPLPQVPANAHDAAYRFAQLHPEQVYFPEYPLSTLLVDKKLYHSASSMREWERLPAEMTVHRDAYLPASMKWVAMRHTSAKDMARLLPEVTEPVRVEGLEEWIVLERRAN